MKYVNLETDLPVNTIAHNFKKADYYDPDEKFGVWSIESYNKEEPGIHLSYDEKSKKVCGYFIDGKDHRDFITSVNNVFSGKIVEKDGKRSIRGFITMAPMYNIIVFLAIVGFVGSFIFLNNNVNIALLAVIFFVYFIYVKRQYIDNGKKIIYFLGECTYKKAKKNNPNKKKGKYARKIG